MTQMSYPPEISSKDIEVLTIIGRGHPDRKMTANQRDGSTQVPALTWSEIQVALNATHSAVSDSIAHLVANKLIDSGRQNPSFWGRLRGDGETYFFWITATGRARLLHENSRQAIDDKSKSSQTKSSSADLDNVEKILIQLGYDISPYGVGVALLGLESDYSAAETASHLALVTLAQDCSSTSDISILLALFTHSMAMIKILSEYRTAGQIRNELYDNDVTAMAKVAYVDEHQIGWIKKVLSDPLIQNDRVAKTRINYEKMLDADDGTETDP
jgi:hypothetical protein